LRALKHLWMAIWWIVVWNTKRMEILEKIRCVVLWKIGELGRRRVLALIISLLAGGTTHWTCQVPIERLHAFYFSVVTNLPQSIYLYSVVPLFCRRMEKLLAGSPSQR
jgi:hypothetical protein